MRERKGAVGEGGLDGLRKLLAKSGFEEAIASLLDVLGDGLRIVDKDFRVVYENLAHRQLLGNHIANNAIVHIRRETWSVRIARSTGLFSTEMFTRTSEVS